MNTVTENKKNNLDEGIYEKISFTYHQFENNINIF